MIAAPAKTLAGKPWMLHADVKTEKVIIEIDKDFTKDSRLGNREAYRRADRAAS